MDVDMNVDMDRMRTERFTHKDEVTMVGIVARWRVRDDGERQRVG